MRLTNKLRPSAKIQHNPTLEDLVIEIDEYVPLKDLVISKEYDFPVGTSKEKKAHKQSGFHMKVVEAKATRTKRSMRTKKGRPNNLDVLVEAVYSLK